MSHHTDEPEIDDEELEEGEDSPRAWSTGSFLAGILVGAAVGAGMALLMAPDSGEGTRRAIRRRMRAYRRDAVGGYRDARKEVRRLLREKKAALQDRVKDLADSLD